MKLNPIAALMYCTSICVAGLTLVSVGLNAHNPEYWIVLGCVMASHLSGLSRGDI